MYEDGGLYSEMEMKARGRLEYWRQGMEDERNWKDSWEYRRSRKGANVGL